MKVNEQNEKNMGLENNVTGREIYKRRNLLSWREKNIVKKRKEKKT